MKTPFIFPDARLLLWGTMVLLTVGCASSRWSVQSRSLTRGAGPGKVLLLGTQLRPGAIVSRAAEARALVWVTELSSAEDFSAAAAVSGRNVVHRALMSPRLTESRHRGQIIELLRSLNAAHWPAVAKIDRLVCEVAALEVSEIRDEAIVSDLLNRPYVRNGADDLVASALARAATETFVCAASVTAGRLRLVLHFNRRPPAEELAVLREAMLAYAEEEGIGVDSDPLYYDPLTASAQIVFHGGVTLVARVFAVHSDQRFDYRLGEARLVSRGSLVMDLLAGPPVKRPPPHGLAWW